jgi:hypothetical protein
MTQHEYNNKVLEILEQIARLSNMSDDDYNETEERISRLQRKLPVEPDTEDYE